MVVGVYFMAAGFPLFTVTMGMVGFVLGGKRIKKKKKKRTRPFNDFHQRVLLGLVYEQKSQFTVIQWHLLFIFVHV